MSRRNNRPKRVRLTQQPRQGGPRRRRLTVSVELTGVVLAICAALTLVFGVTSRNSRHEKALTEASGVHVATIYDLSQERWIAPLPAGSVGPVQDCDARRAADRVRWLISKGGMPTLQNTIRVLVTNDTSSDVVVDGPTISYLKSSPVRPGTPIDVCEGGGPFEEPWIALDLDRSEYSCVGDAGGTPIDCRALIARRHSTLDIYMVARGTKRSYQWSATLRYWMQGHEYRAKIDHNGAPFDLDPCTAPRRASGSGDAGCPITGARAPLWPGLRGPWAKAV
jgi:hypothetical protein